MQRNIVELLEFSRISTRLVQTLSFYSPEDVIYIDEDEGERFNLIYSSNNKSTVKVKNDNEVMDHALYENSGLTYLFIQFHHKKGVFSGNLNGMFAIDKEFNNPNLSRSLITLVEGISQELGSSTVYYMGFRLDMEEPLKKNGYTDCGIVNGLPRLGKYLSTFESPL